MHVLVEGVAHALFVETDRALTHLDEAVPREGWIGALLTISEWVRTYLARDESRHIAFYTTQATKRLEESKLARAFTRFALSKVWGPVGSTIEPEEEVRFVMGYLFDGPDGLREVRKMDEAIAKLPGMQGLAVNEHAFRARGLYADLPAAA